MKKDTTHKLTVAAMLSAVAFILMFIEFPIPMLIPAFIKMDFSDLPALLGAFALNTGFRKEFFSFSFKRDGADKQGDANGEYRHNQHHDLDDIPLVFANQRPQPTEVELIAKKDDQGHGNEAEQQPKDLHPRERLDGGKAKERRVAHDAQHLQASAEAARRTS